MLGCLVVQPDGKLVAAGGIDFALARYNPDGSLDRSFGKRGRVRSNFGLAAVSLARALVLQPDGKLVAAGEFFGRTAGGIDVLLARFNANGSLDASFGAGGAVRTDFGGFDRAFALVLQPDGKLVAAGDRQSGVVLDLILARYHPDGSLDASFGAGGFVVESGGSFTGALLLQPDGKLVAAGGGASGAELFRFNPDGSLDASFRGGPLLLGRFTALALQSDGKLVAAGHSSENVILARFNPDLSRDTSFGTGGLVVTTLGNATRASALVLQADGKLVAGGAFGIFSRSGPRFIVLRYHPDGSLDVSFGSGGVRTDVGGSFLGARALVLQADGKLVAAGGTGASDDLDFALVRYVTTNEPLGVPPTCGGRPATILGTSRKDTIRGTRGPDVILGLGGNDTIRGLKGADTICGGAGRDTLIGNDGKDRLLGENGDDELFGDSGRDRLDGGSGRDACRTGETARRCEGKPASSKPASGERPKDPPRPPCPAMSNFPCS